MHAMEKVVGAESQNFGQASGSRGEQRRVLGKGRGRGIRRVDEGFGMDEVQEEVVGTYDKNVYEAVMRGDTEAVKAALFQDKIDKGEDAPEYFSYYEDMMAATATSVRESPATLTSSGSSVKTAPKKAPKTNGYCLFMKHMGRETETSGSINELMAIFDKDWKDLPEEEKKMWKERAKSGWKPDFRKYGKGRGRGSDRAPPTTQGAAQMQQEKDYDTGEEDDEFF